MAPFARLEVPARDMDHLSKGAAVDRLVFAGRPPGRVTDVNLPRGAASANGASLSTTIEFTSSPGITMSSRSTLAPDSWLGRPIGATMTGTDTRFASGRRPVKSRGNIRF
jgi:hypothetical protein